MKQTTVHYNTGNNYGKNNAGNSYNKIFTKTNGYSSDKNAEPIKVIVHRNNEMKITYVSIYYNGNFTNDVTTPPTYIARITNKWHSKTFNYYRNGKFVMSDTIYSKYYKETEIFIKEMEG